VSGFVADAIAQELGFLRAEAEARMTARVSIRRKSSLAPQNETTGRETPAWATVATDVPFRLDSGSSSDGGTRRVETGGVEYQQATATGHLPATQRDLSDGDLLEVTSGEWAGSVWRVVEASFADQKTARRVPIVQESRPEEWG
jgi:hypothetical protein